MLVMVPILLYVCFGVWAPGPLGPVLAHGIHHLAFPPPSIHALAFQPGCVNVDPKYHVSAVTNCYDRILSSVPDL
jgi:hypothetical protein